MSEWKETTLGEISLKITDGAHHSPKEFDCGKPMFSVKNMRDQGFDYNGVKTISDEDFVKLVNSGCQPQKDDILIAKDGSVMKHVFRVKGAIDYVLLSSIAIVRPDKSKVNPSYLVYAIKDPSTTDLILNNFVGGSGVPRIVLKDFKKVDLTIPSLDTQKSIASILSSLDDKIDLLHRQNATLEKMAETLFRQWFVEEAKEEWDEGTLDDILTVKGGSTPSTSEPAYWNGKIHWTSPKDITNLNGIYLFDTERKITELGLSKISSGLLPKGTLLMSSRAPVGVLAFCEVPVAINQGYIAILDNKGYSKEFIYLWLKANIDVVHSFSNGSTFMEISKTAFKTLQLQLPPKQVMTDFQLLVKPLFNKIKSNHIQIRTLTALRDTLLPKLMSGEVRVD